MRTAAAGAPPASGVGTSGYRGRCGIYHYRPAFNAEFARPAREAGSAFVACPDAERLDAILCEQYERRVGADNCVRFHRRVLQIPPDRYRCHYVKAKVTVLQHPEAETV